MKTPERFLAKSLFLVMDLIYGDFTPPFLSRGIKHAVKIV
jgi:hypothetical protein